MLGAFQTAVEEEGEPVGRLVMELGGAGPRPWGVGSPVLLGHCRRGGLVGDASPFRTPGAEQYESPRPLPWGGGGSGCPGWVWGVTCGAAACPAALDAVCSLAPQQSGKETDPQACELPGLPPTGLEPTATLPCPPAPGAGGRLRPSQGGSLPPNPRGAPTSEQGSSPSRELRRSLPPGRSCPGRDAQPGCSGCSGCGRGCGFPL